MPVPNPSLLTPRAAVHPHRSPTPSRQHAAAPAHPVVALAVPGRLRLWHKPDTTFGTPKAVLYLDVQVSVCVCACAWESLQYAKDVKVGLARHALTPLWVPLSPFPFAEPRGLRQPARSRHDPVRKGQRQLTCRPDDRL